MYSFVFNGIGGWVGGYVCIFDHGLGGDIRPCFYKWPNSAFAVFSLIDMR